MVDSSSTRRFRTDLELSGDITVTLEQQLDPNVAHFVVLCSAGYLEQFTNVQYPMMLNSQYDQLLVRAIADAQNKGKRVQLWACTTSLELDILECGKKGKASVSLSVDAVSGHWLTPT